MKIRRNYPQTLVPMRKYGVGPSNTWKFELRISGPSISDPGVLRSLADQVVAIMETRMNTDYQDIKSYKKPNIFGNLCPN